MATAAKQKATFFVPAKGSTILKSGPVFGKGNLIGTLHVETPASADVAKHGRKALEGIDGATDYNDKVVYRSQAGGSAGNNIQVGHFVGATGAGNENRVLAVLVVGNDISVTFGTDGGGASVVPAASAIADLVNANAAASALVTATVSGDGAGTAAGTSALTPLLSGDDGQVKLDSGDGASFSADDVVGESLGASGSTNYAVTLAGAKPIKPGSVEIRDGNLQIIRDDGDGNFRGLPADLDNTGANTINYATGAIDVTFQDTTTNAPTASYESDDGKTAIKHGARHAIDIKGDAVRGSDDQLRVSSDGAQLECTFISDGPVEVAVA